MLDQINSARNMGNANAALAHVNFACADQISTEFLLQLIRLSGEDFKGSLIDQVFNEAAAVAFINSIIEEVEQSEFDNPSPEHLAISFQMVLDHVLELSPQQNQQAPDDTDCDDMYENNNHENGLLEIPNSDIDASGGEEEGGLQPNPDNLINDEAQEVLEGVQSPSGSSEEESQEESKEELESAVGGEDEDDEEERVQPPSYEAIAQDLPPATS